MKRSTEWYEAYQQRTARHVDTDRPTQAQKTEMADAWNGKAAPIYPLVTLCRAAKIAEPLPEFRFHPTRKWRFDYAWPLAMLALEVDGGVWTQGRHTRGAGAIADMEKLSEAAILGWRVLYAVPDDLNNGLALDRVMRALTDRLAA